MFEVPDSNVKKVRITEACVKGISPPEYDRDEASKSADSVTGNGCIKGVNGRENDKDELNKLADSVKAFISFF